MPRTFYEKDLVKAQFGLKRAQVCLRLTQEEQAQHAALCAHHHIDFSGLVQMSLLACVEDYRRGHQKALAESLRAFIRTPPTNGVATKNARIQPTLRDAAMLPMREHVQGVKVATFIRWALISQHTKFMGQQAVPQSISRPAPAPQQPQTTPKPLTGFYEDES